MNLPTLEDRFVALIRDHKKLIYKACHSYTTTKDDFKDLEQEIIVQLWKAFPLEGVSFGRRFRAPIPHMFLGEIEKFEREEEIVPREA